MCPTRNSSMTSRLIDASTRLLGSYFEEILPPQGGSLDKGPHTASLDTLPAVVNAAAAPPELVIVYHRLPWRTLWRPTHSDFVQRTYLSRISAAAWAAPSFHHAETTKGTPVVDLAHAPASYSPMLSYIFEMAFPNAAAKNSVILLLADTLGSSSCLKKVSKNGVAFLRGRGLLSLDATPCSACASASTCETRAGTRLDTAGRGEDSNRHDVRNRTW